MFQDSETKELLLFAKTFTARTRGCLLYSVGILNLPWCAEATCPPSTVFICLRWISEAAGAVFSFALCKRLIITLLSVLKKNKLPLYFRWWRNMKVLVALSLDLWVCACDCMMWLSFTVCIYVFNHIGTCVYVESKHM